MDEDSDDEDCGGGNVDGDVDDGDNAGGNVVDDGDNIEDVCVKPHGSSLQINPSSLF